MRKDLKRTLSKNKPKLYLASHSPRRTEILNKLKIDHDIIPNLLEDESLFFNKRQSLNTAVRRLCKAKAEASKEGYKGLIISMDTIVFLDVTVGHGAILHGCMVEDQCLIGMGAIVLNGAIIKKGAVVAAGAVVKENMIVEPLELVAGVPAKVIKKLDESTYHHHIKWAEKYCKLAEIHRNK